MDAKTSQKPKATRSYKTGNKPDAIKVVETYIAKTVRTAYENGTVTCDNVKHYTLVTLEGVKFKVPRVKKTQLIFDMMDYGEKAVCTCQKEAMRTLWTARPSPGIATSTWVSFGSYVKGIQLTEPKMVWPTKFQLTAEQRATLEGMFRGWHIHTYGDRQHDHPIAHVGTELTTHTTLQLVSQRRSKTDTQQILDLHGSPDTCDTFNSSTFRGKTAHMDCHVNAECPADAIRQAVKWGPAFEGERRRYWKTTVGNLAHQPDFSWDKYDTTFLNHAIYYHDFNSISNILQQMQGGVVTAILHRHKGDKGTVNGGEQTYVKFELDGGIHVRQTNHLTGESYTHRDTEPWFEKSYWDDGTNAISWTVGSVGGDFYSITAAKCALCDFSDYNDAPIVHEVQMENQTEANIKLTNKVVFRGEERDIGDATFFFEMVRQLQAKPRTPTVCKDHAARCQRYFVSNKSKISVDQFRQLQWLSWGHGLKEDTHAIDEYMQEYQTFVATYNHFVQGGGTFHSGVGKIDALVDITKTVLLATSGKTGAAIVSVEGLARRVAAQGGTDATAKSITNVKDSILNVKDVVKGLCVSAKERYDVERMIHVGL